MRRLLVVIEHSESAERNKHEILPVLREILPAEGAVLELACGTGQQAVHWSAEFPGLAWQPSDIDPVALQSTGLRVEEAGIPSLRGPLPLDVTREDWPVADLDAVLCINMIHISPWAACLGVLRGARRVLRPGGLLFLYGPYLQKGKKTAPSNLDFDASLRERDPEWGVRLLEDVVEAAEERGLTLREVRDMPNNNLSVLFDAPANPA